MSNSVNVTYICVSKSTTCKIWAFKHITSCFKVLTVIVCFFDIIKDKLCSLFSFFDSFFGITLSDISFNCVSKSIHTGCRSNMRWQAYCKLRVKYSVLRPKTSIVNSILLVSFRVSYYCGNSCFRACTCCCRNSEERWKCLMNFKLTSHSTNRLLRLYNPCTCCFSAVHWRTAAKCYNALTVVLIIHILALFDIRDSRVRLNTIINNIFNPNFFEFLE